MSKFLDETGLSHFWSKIKTLLAGKANADHTHDDYVTQTYLDQQQYASIQYMDDAIMNHTHTEYATETYVDEQISNTEGLIQDVDDRVTALEESADSASHKFKILGRQTLAANGYADLSTFLTAYDELMIIVRTVSSASVTIGPSNTTSGSSGFLCSKSVTGTTYTKIMVNKTDEGYLAWDIAGNVGWSNSTAYKYLRNYTTASSITMSVVVHGR